jgi:hypothetical protein
MEDKAITKAMEVEALTKARILLLLSKTTTLEVDSI